MTVEILCRFDAGKQTPVVFLRDTIQGDKIQVWDGQGNPKLMPLDYYRMTSPLSAEDERVLAERFRAATGRQEQVVHINHRMPRTMRPLPNMLASGSAAKQESAKPSRSKPIEQQAAPAGPGGDLPRPNETPALMQPVSAPTAQTVDANEPASASLFRRIQELNRHVAALHSTIITMNTELQKATTDYEASKVACVELTKELEAALDKEAAEELRKRKEMLSALASGIPELPTLAQAAQALHDSETTKQEEPKEAAAPEPVKEEVKEQPKAEQPRVGGRFVKGSAPAKH